MYCYVAITECRPDVDALNFNLSLTNRQTSSSAKKMLFRLLGKLL